MLYTHHYVADRPPAPFSVDAVPETLAEIQVLGSGNQGNEGTATESTTETLATESTTETLEPEPDASTSEGVDIATQPRPGLVSKINCIL